jgi:hypothetical protein
MSPPRMTRQRRQRNYPSRPGAWDGSRDDRAFLTPSRDGPEPGDSAGTERVSLQGGAGEFGDYCSRGLRSIVSALAPAQLPS